MLIYYSQLLSFELVYNESMEQSQYLKNLLKRLDEATEQLQYKNQTSNPHTLSTIKFERDELESNAHYSKGQYIQTDGQNKYIDHTNTLKQQINHNHNILQEISMIDNTKTSRNNPILKFDPSKSRKKSQHSHYRQLQSKRQPTTRRDKKDLIEVRDKLNDIIAFLNTKIQSNPQVSEIKKVVNLQDVRQSNSPKNQFNIKPHKSLDNVNNSNDVLYIPKYQLNDAKLGKSIQIINHHPNDAFNKEYLNLKHSFDKLNNVNLSNSNRQVQQSRFFANYANPSIQRTNLHIIQPQNNQHFRNYAQIPVNSINRLPISILQNNIQRKPNIFINGRKLNDSASHNNVSFVPATRHIRPFSQNPQLRYINQTPSHNFYLPESNNINKNTIVNQPIYQKPQTKINQIPSIYPTPINLGPPSFRRIASRPLSTKRSNTQPFSNFQRQQKFVPKYLQRQNIPIPIKKQQNLSKEVEKNYIPSNNQQDLQKNRLRKKTSLNNFFKQTPIYQYKNISINNLINDNSQKQILNAKDELQQILPQPKPYKRVSNNIENPFNKPELSISKKSQKIKGGANNELLQSIAQQSQQNHLTKNMQASGKSSERMMSSVNSNLYLSKVKKFEGGGSTKLKRKGIDVSSKQIYMSQYSRHP